MSTADRILHARHQAGRQAHERLAAQAAFVRALAGRGAAGGVAAADAADAAFAAALARGAAPADALAEGERHLLPFAGLAKSYQVVCLGHAHIDMNWQWGYHETVATGAASFSTLLTLMEEFPDLTFVQSQAALYEMMRQHHPALFARIRAAIAGGRWQVAAGQWVEAERNTLGGESFVRQALLARAWCAEHLDLAPAAVAIDWVPDCFGHAASLPGLLAQAGFTWSYAWRTGTTTRPPVFRWRGLDGREVLVWRDLCGYNGEPWADAWRHCLTMEDLAGQKLWLNIVGIGDHGGGPTRRHLRRAADLATWPVFPSLRWGRLDEVLDRFAAVRERLPVHDGELNTEFSGCLTSQSRIKRGNRRGEALCAEAETASALATRLVGLPPDREQLRQAWRRVCFGQFHDILPGSGVAATREHHAAAMQEAAAACTAVASDALRAICARIDTAWVGATAAASALEPDLLGGGAGCQVGATATACAIDAYPAAAVWWNPVAEPRDEVAVLRVWEGERPWDAHPGLRLRLRCADGSLPPVQRLGGGNFWGHHFHDLAVPVRVGALGWATMAVEEGEAPPPATPATAAIADEGGRNHPPVANRPSGPATLENGRLRVAFDRASGMPSSIVRDGVELLAAPVQLVVVDERPVPMSAWILGDAMGERLPVCEAFTVAHPGPVRAALRARLRWGDTTATAEWTLDAGCDRLHLRVTARWLMTGSATTAIPRLVLRLPTRLADAQLTHDIPHGALARDVEPGRPMPTRSWVRADSAAGSLVVANDGVHAAAIDRGGITLDLLRASYDPDPLPEIGDHAWEFSLRPGAPQDDADSRRDGLRLAHPLRAVLERVHAGDLPAESGDLVAAGDGVQVAAVKPAETGSGVIVRLLNTRGRSADARLELHPLLTSLAAPCDMLERPAPGGPIPAHGVATVRLDAGA